MTAQPEGMAVGVWISGIGVEAHSPDGRPGGKSAGGMPMTSGLATGTDNARYRMGSSWPP
jgi:hypothetical protein